jgi:tetratricopeptide (TPR) repeat protein
MEPAVKAQLETGDRLYREGRFDAAGAAYLKAQELAPENATVLERLGTIALWNHDPGEAERYFEKALRHTPWYKSFWPLNAQLKYRLGTAYYRQDRFAEVAQLFREARGPVAIGPLRDLGTLGEQMALFENETPYVIEGPAETDDDVDLERERLVWGSQARVVIGPDSYIVASSQPERYPAGSRFSEPGLPQAEALVAEVLPRASSC